MEIQSGKYQVLVVDDELQIRRLLQISLEEQGYLVKLASNGREALVAAGSHPPDLILLDIGLPDIHGKQLLKELREWYQRPIIILSAMNDESNIVEALDHGANDYITKPFRVGELQARIRNALRGSNEMKTSEILDFGDLKIDLPQRIVTSNDTDIKLTVTEYNLLILLAKNEGRVLTHQFLLREIWGYSYVEETQYLRVFIAALRKKIEVNPNKPVHITTESGVGYRFQ
jgi:two-component system KDP operon response regulator KdpE